MSVLDRYRAWDRRALAVLAPWIYLALPGVALHELAHAAAGSLYGDATIDWTVPEVRMDWGSDRVPVWGLFGFFLAPLAVGGVTAFALPLVFPLVPAWVDVWLLINWLLLAGPSVADVWGVVVIMTEAWQADGQTDE